jgi:hypothetical protein
MEIRSCSFIKVRYWICLEKLKNITKACQDIHVRLTINYLYFVNCIIYYGVF